jgi:hypothetical protein
LGDIYDNVNNLIEDGSCNPLFVGNPNLGPLIFNGGLSFTQALLPGSIAINAGDNLSVPPFITTDQRGFGFPRISDNKVDIGAFEAQDVPEPSGLMGLMILSIAGLYRWRRRR